MNPNIGLSDAQRSDVVAMLARALADAHVLYIKTRNYHWNVSGPRFQPLHEFFEQQYTQLAGSIDEIAERIRALGAASPGTMTEFLATTRLHEQTGPPPAADVMLTRLLADHEAVVRQLRTDVDRCGEIGDAGTQDFLTGLTEQHEKMAWMLRAFAE